MNVRIDIRKIKLILIHVFIGTGIFYFLIHPFTMVVYWFEYSEYSFSIELFREIFLKRLFESFTFNMVGMSGLFSILGAILGLLSGLFWISFIKKKNLVKKQEHLMKSHLELNQYFAETDRWTRDEIEERATHLTNLALSTEKVEKLKNNYHLCINNSCMFAFISQ